MSTVIGMFLLLLAVVGVGYFGFTLVQEIIQKRKNNSKTSRKK